MKKTLFLFFAILGVLALAGCTSYKNAEFSSALKDNLDGTKITVYKSPSCDCCGSYTAELKKAGFQVETVNVQDMAAIKEKHNIPQNMESCHTAVIGQYFIEGHVPIEAINKLLEEKPAISGIALPGMPSGSLGMSGRKRAPFKIYALSDGNYSEFMTI